MHDGGKKRLPGFFAQAGGGSGLLKMRFPGRRQHGTGLRRPVPRLLRSGRPCDACEVLRNVVQEGRGGAAVRRGQRAAPCLPGGKAAGASAGVCPGDALPARRSGTSESLFSRGRGRASFMRGSEWKMVL